jgi:hypothetical protein
MTKAILFIAAINLLLAVAVSAQPKSGNPADNLPENIRRITQFGERADFSHDGKKILFVEKTYGDVYEVELSSGKISLITGHFYHGGFTRALYLANDDVLLSGCTRFNAANPHINRQKNANYGYWIKAIPNHP